MAALRNERTVIRLKKYRQGAEALLAACDADLLGKTLAEGKMKLAVDPGFYDGFEATDADFEAQLRTSTIANLVGERVVGLAIQMGFVSSENVIRIQGVPHAQWALFR